MSNVESIAKLAQAQGIVTIQADCTLDDALRKMLDRAQINHQSVSQIADAVVAHQIWFR
jgi:AmiR/NasT family two-component response regulator